MKRVFFYTVIGVNVVKIKKDELLPQFMNAFPSSRSLSEAQLREK